MRVPELFQNFYMDQGISSYAEKQWKIHRLPTTSNEISTTLPVYVWVSFLN